ncbi:MAG: hypothetical protein ACRDTF_18580 [Pseudonocardiaceae bacterium]
MYRVIVHDQAQATVDVLPPADAVCWPDVLNVLGLVPWNGNPWSEDNPDGNIRTLPFGAAGMVTYLILERDREVHVLEVQWVG